ASSTTRCHSGCNASRGSSSLPNSRASSLITGSKSHSFRRNSNADKQAALRRRALVLKARAVIGSACQRHWDCPWGYRRSSVMKLAGIGVVRLGTIVALAGLAAGCSSIQDHRGYIADQTLVGAIQPGIDNKTSVEGTLGRPTFKSQFGEETWYY